jgi:MFS family permease
VDVTADRGIAPGEATVYERRWWALLVLCLSLVIVVMDNTILNVALPTLARDLQTSGSELQWIVDAYVLVFAGLVLTMGSLGDRFGRKLTLNGGLVLFAAASVASAFADSPGVLVASRAGMGIGGALIMPSTLSIITSMFRRGSAAEPSACGPVSPGSASSSARSSAGGSWRASGGARCSW